MFQKLGQKFQRFMIGRNGPDNLARFSLWVALVLMLIGVFVPDAVVSRIFTGAAFVAIAYCYFRVFSRKLAKRSEENRTYIRLSSRVTLPLRRMLARFGEWRTYHKTHRLYTCKKCGQSLRVPKGKGTIKVTCPKCGESFTVKS